MLSLLRWVASFLQGRAQVTRVGASVSTPLCLNGGIPQDTKLGPMLFAVMVNDLVQSWAPALNSWMIGQFWRLYLAIRHPY